MVRLVRVFLLQAMAISVAVLLGVFAVSQVVENVLVREALEGEAGHFWARHALNPDHAPPDTMNLMGFTAQIDETGVPDYARVPNWLRNQPLGYGRANAPSSQKPLVHVSEQDGTRLYLVFDEVQVSNLVILFGVAPLALVLIIIYALTWIGYRMSHAAVSPIVQLAERVEQFDFATNSFEDLALDEFQVRADTEVWALTEALQHFVRRFEEFIARERNFTRNASHELRTPITVLKGNLELLKRRFNLPEKRDEVVQRMERNVRDMQSLLETLLVLAREDETRLPSEPVILNDFLQTTMQQVQDTFCPDGVEMRFEPDTLLQVNAPEKVLDMIFTNLLRNACQHTEEGEICISIQDHTVLISDTGAGMSDEVLQHATEPFFRGSGAFGAGGYGLGLSIVHRLCQRFGWQINFASHKGQGTVARLQFPDGKVLGGG